jgi:outer membrane protein TolC
MKRIFFFSLALFCLTIIQAETITLDSCRAKARNHYPLIQQFGLIEKTKQFSLEAASNNWLPQVSLSARATYQSDITELPAALTNVLTTKMGLTLEPFQKQDQYQAVIEASQLLWDGGQISAQKSAIKANAEIEKQKTEVDLYAINDRINNLYFGILLIREQLTGQNLLLEELQSNLKKAESMKSNGLLLQADIDAVKVEIIYAKQRIYDLHSAQKNYSLILSAFTGMEINENTSLEKPDTEVEQFSGNNRPELKLFEAQNIYINTQEKALFASNLPKIGVFVQGGYGRPSLNMFNPALAPYYIGGIRLSWNLSGFYSQKANLDKIEISRKNVEVMKETFLFNNKLQSTQHQIEIDKIKENLKNDFEIIGFRTNIKKTAESKMTNGTITVTDLLREINAEHLARQQKAIHEVQLFMAVYQLKTDINQL